MEKALPPSALVIQTHLERVGAKTTNAIALALGLSKNTVRSSLERLVRAGSLEQIPSLQTGERGRPAYQFRATSAS